MNIEHLLIWSTEWGSRVNREFVFLKSAQILDTAELGLIYIYSIGQQGKPYIKAFDLRLEAVQHNIDYITIYNISAQIQ